MASVDRLDAVAGGHLQPLGDEVDSDHALGAERTGDAAVGDMPMPDEPLAVDEWGTTEFEERTGEPLGVRLARETPDVGPFNTDEGTRFSEPGADADYSDFEGDAVGDIDVSHYDTVSPEEAAMHIVDEDQL